MSLEPIVRPFQLPDVTLPQRYVTPGQASHPPVELFVKFHGNLNINAEMGQYKVTTTTYCTKQIVEKSTPTP
jgi:hypothetical protein